MPRSDRRRACTGVLAALTVLLAGCGTISGRAEPQLDVGAYDTRPLAVPPDNDNGYSRLVESARLSDVVINPGSLQTGLTDFSTAPVPTPNLTVGILADSVRPALLADGMLAGFSFGGLDHPDAQGEPQIGVSTALRITILRMRDATAARAAAADIDTDDFAVNPDNRSIGIPNYPDAHAHWRPQVPTMAATVAHGAFVVTLFIAHPTPDSTAMADLAAATFAAQLGRLDAFVPTPADTLTSLPLDRDGILQRTLPVAPRKWPYPSAYQQAIGKVAGWGGYRRSTGLVYGEPVADGWLNPPGEGDSIPVERLAIVDWDDLIRLPDAVSATKALRKLRARLVGAGYDAVSPPPGVPDAGCYRNAAVTTDAQRELGYVCWVMDGRYVANVHGADETAVHQKAAAQYALLVNSE
ncbi:hypothetical protein ACFXHA_32880 [Nocardia sp. NPDC059240]|uniref:DUF7373 family lipoprotein n=1 Tax=Nocardia sp. NPDC059240 TaxID=3346786 RepID=UPI0036CB9EB9